MKVMIDQNRMLEKNLPLYVPKKYDKIDLALAMAINNYPEKDKL